MILIKKCKKEIIIMSVVVLIISIFIATYGVNNNNKAIQKEISEINIMNESGTKVNVKDVVYKFKNDFNYGVYLNGIMVTDIIWNNDTNYRIVSINQIKNIIYIEN